MKNATLLVAALALLSVTGCQSIGDEVQPRNYDALALENGHWEWEKTIIGFSPVQTPVTVGFTRQLVFESDGHVSIQHNRKRAKTPGYTLSMGTLAGCGAAQPAVPIIAYDNDPEVKTGMGGNRKAYTVSKSGVDQYLFLTYDYACVDGGA
jgi:hypothetical protein